MRKAPILIEKLVKHLMPVSDSDVGLYQSLALRLLSSRVEPSVVQDEFGVRDLILRKLSSRDANKFNELYIKLTKRRVITKRWSIMYLFYRLSEEPGVFTVGGPLESIPLRPIRQQAEHSNLDLEP
jgi:hypothetical protein